jgi:hypothetical protein
MHFNKCKTVCKFVALRAGSERQRTQVAFLAWMLCSNPAASREIGPRRGDDTRAGRAVLLAALYTGQDVRGGSASLLRISSSFSSARHVLGAQRS